MTEPCEGATNANQWILMVGQVVQLLFISWLSHRRKVADSERHHFYAQMRHKHDLPEPKDVDRVRYREDTE